MEVLGRQLNARSLGFIGEIWAEDIVGVMSIYGATNILCYVQINTGHMGHFLMDRTADFTMDKGCGSSRGQLAHTW